MSPTAGMLLVVGAGPGLGLAAARRFGREGHPVGLVGRNTERLTRMAEQLDADGVPTADGNGRRHRRRGAGERDRAAA